MKEISGINFISEKVMVDSAGDLRDISFQVKNGISNLFLILGAEIEGKANLSIYITEDLISQKSLDASVLISEIARHINGGGGGQPFFATAGGKNPEGIGNALKEAERLISGL